MNKMFLHFSDFFVETFSVILILFCRNTVETFFNVEKTLRSNSYFIELHTTNLEVGSSTLSGRTNYDFIKL